MIASSLPNAYILFSLSLSLSLPLSLISAAINIKPTFADAFSNLASAYKVKQLTPLILPVGHASLNPYACVIVMDCDG